MITRRAAILAILSLVAMPRISFALVQCSIRNPYTGIEKCSAGVEIDGFTAEQEKDHWCWAACIQAVFNYHGYSVSQKRIVHKVFPKYNDNSGAVGPQIVQAVNGHWTTDDGEDFSAHAKVLLDTQFFFKQPDAAAVAARELAKDNPLILGAMGHAVMLSAMSYLRDNSGHGQPQSLTVRDPWPGSPNKRILSPTEALQTSFLVAIHVKKGE